MAVKEMWVVRGGVKGHSVYPRQDVNIYDVRVEEGKTYNMGGWFGPNWFPVNKWWGNTD